MRPLKTSLRLIIFPVIILVAGYFSTTVGCDAEGRKLLVELDREIGRKDLHERDKRMKIDRLRHELDCAVDDSARFGLARELFNEYKNYNMDTALIVAGMCIKMAHSVRGDTLAPWRAKLMMAEALKGVGNYDRSQAMLDSMPFLSSGPLRHEYLNRYCSLFLSLYEATKPRSEAARYRSKLVEYRDSMSRMSAPGTWNQVLNLAEKYKLLGKPQEALDLYLGYVNSGAPDSADISTATMAHLIGETYRMLGDKNRAINYLAQSAIQDIRNCTKKYVALQELAYILNEDGDSERAYRYITCSLGDIKACNARSRVYQIADMVPVINDAFDLQTKRTARNKTWVILSLLALGVVSVVMLLLLKSRNRRLNAERERLNRCNGELEEMKNRLDGLIAELKTVNDRLEESNHVKEEYIGYLFSMCAGYVDDTEKFRQQLARQIKVGQIKEVEATLSKPMRAASMKAFLSRFDAIFLDIFPDFVEEFNKLLAPEGRIYPPAGELLTPELRIYALVRLGITDSTKIAAFLNYSPQTVYNYRMRVRNNAIVPKKEFATRVQELMT